MVPIAVETILLVPSEDVGIEDAMRSLAAFDWLVFTSAAGVEFFSKKMDASSLTIPSTLRVAAVGRGTAEALGDMGVEVAFTPPEFTAESLGRTLPGRGRVMILHADIASKDLAEALGRRGFDVRDVTLYRTESRTGVVGEEVVMGADAIMFASPSAVRTFCGRLSGPALTSLTQRLPAACIGPSTARAASEAGFKKLIIPEEHTFDRLIEEIRRMQG